MLNSEIKKVAGSVLGIGLDEKKQELIEKNSSVLECFLLNSNATNSELTKGYTKTINIKKIKKFFHKHSFDYIICDFEEVKPYLRSFIKNSIYLNNKIIYFYNINDYDLCELKKRYTRYHSIFDNYKDYIVINNVSSKTNILKNTIFYFQDLIYDIIDYIGNLFC